MSLVAAGILELDSNGDLLLTASHPSVEDGELEVIKSRSGLVNGKEAALLAFVCSRLGANWHYIACVDADSDSRVSMPLVDRFAVFVIAKDFCPEKYSALCKVLVAAHKANGNAVNLMRAFVDLTISKKHTNAELSLSFAEGDFDPRRSLLASPLKGLVETFGNDLAVLWLGMVLKRRVFVLAPSPAEALHTVRALPLLVWHRSNWSLLRPVVTPTDQEEEDLKQAGIFCAGVVGEDNPLPRQVPHDVFVDVAEQSVRVTDSGRDLMAFAEIAYVKEVMKEVKAVAQSQNDQAVIKVLTTKTKDLLGKVQKLKAAVEPFTIQGLSSFEPALPNGMPQLAFSLAVAEGLV